MHPIAMIDAKKSGNEHSRSQLNALVQGYVSGAVPDYQMAAWLMAVRWQGLSQQETTHLTEVMAASGRVLDLAAAGLSAPFIDKHSTGGVGDKLTLIVVPILIACGATVVKMSGRGLGHTGGTIDKLESIPGFQAELGLDQVLDCARAAGGCIAAQSGELVPADGMMYALRDATATVDSLPLIAASIMSKKLASGAHNVLLDVKVGRGAFMRTVAQATELARLMVDIATGAGRRAVAVLTAMDEPLGAAVGNAVEVNEALDVLRGAGPPAVRAISIELSAQALALAAAAAPGTSDLDSARHRATAVLSSGNALESLMRVVRQQGGDCSLLSKPSGLASARAYRAIAAPRSGQIGWIDALAVGRAAVRLGAGRKLKGESVDPGAGLLLKVEPGAPVTAGQIMAEMWASDEQRLDEAAATLAQAWGWLDDSEQTAATLGSGTVLSIVEGKTSPQTRPSAQV